MIKKESGTYKRMSMMRKGFNGNGSFPNLFEPEKKCVNKIMDIVDESPEITDIEISKIKKELDVAENSEHYNGSAWFDFKLHLNGLLSQVGYEVEFGTKSVIVSIKKVK